MNETFKKIHILRLFRCCGTALLLKKITAFYGRNPIRLKAAKEFGQNSKCAQN